MPKLKSQNRKESVKLMKTYRNIILGSMLIFMLSVSLVACGGKTAKTDPWSHAKHTESIEFGEGAKTVTVAVQVEEHAIDLTLHTDKENLEEALLEHELISGDKGPYGLYVKVVNGITADYDIDRTYWSLCQGGIPMQTGVSETPISDGDRFELVYTK